MAVSSSGEVRAGQSACSVRTRACRVTHTLRSQALATIEECSDGGATAPRRKLKFWARAAAPQYGAVFELVPQAHLLSHT